MYRMGCITVAMCVILCSVALIFFSFHTTRTSVDKDVLEQSPEVRVNEVLLYNDN